MTLFPLLFSLACSFFASRLELIAEVLALRLHLAIRNRTATGPSPRFQDLRCSIASSNILQGWRAGLLLGESETVIKWHRHRIQLYWCWKSQTGAQDVQESMPKFANLFAGSHERTRCGA